MKNFLQALLSLCAVALLVTGCATVSRDRENALAAAGFRTVVASTAAQRQQLQALPPGQITPLRRGKETVFILPDPDRNILYVGREANYQQYRRYRLQQRLAEQNLAAAQMWNDPGWGGWGPWYGYWY